MPPDRPLRTRPPVWPVAMLGAFAVLATVSVLQGMVDVVLPTLRGEDPFGFLFGATERFGPLFFVAYIFVHNLGLACVVPGFGFLAAKFERNKANRFLIGVLLSAAVLVSLLVAGQYILLESERFNLPIALTLLVGETCGVLALAFAAMRELRGFVPTRRYEWSLVTPFRNLRVPFAYSVGILLILSLWEAYAVL